MAEWQLFKIYILISLTWKEKHSICLRSFCFHFSIRNSQIMIVCLRNSHNITQKVFIFFWKDIHRKKRRIDNVELCAVMMYRNQSASVGEAKWSKDIFLYVVLTKQIIFGNIHWAKKYLSLGPIGFLIVDVGRIFNGKSISFRSNEQRSVVYTIMSSSRLVCLWGKNTKNNNYGSFADTCFSS